MLLSREQIDEQQWNTFVEKSPQGYIYHYTWYLDVVCPNWKAIVVKNNQEWLAVMPLNLKQKWGIKHILQPSLCQFLGILFAPQSTKLYKQLSDKKDWVSEIIAHIPKDVKLFNYNFSPYFDYPLPFYWQKYNLLTRFNYELDLSISAHSLIENIYPRVRRYIRNAEKESELEVQVSTDIDAFLCNQKQTQRFFFNSYFQNLAKELYNRAYTKGKATLLLATQKNKIITGTLLLHYKNSWINFYGLSKNEQENEQASVEILLWNAILLAKQNGATRFDFEGSMIEGVERIFRRFGAKPVPYLNITKNALPIFLRWLY